MPDRASASGAGAAAGRGWSTSTAQGDVRQPRILTPFVDSGNYLGGLPPLRTGLRLAAEMKLVCAEFRQLLDDASS
jgi:hypothetical protein